MSTSLGRRSLLVAAGAVAVAHPALSQAYPSRIVRILIGFGAGGPGDVLARLYAQKLQQILGGTFIVENRPGGAQLIAIRALTSALPDGHTLMLATGSGLVQGPGVYRELPYNPLRDFSLIGLVATTPGLLYCNPTMPFATVPAFIDYAKANAGKLNYGSAGVGSAGHFQMEYLKHLAGLDLVHVPYRSDQEVAREVMAGSLQVALTTVQPALPLIAAGGLRAIAVTGSRRIDLLPEVPSLAETEVSALQGIDYYTFYGMVGPAGMDEAVVTRLNAAINQVAGMADVVAQMRSALAFDAATGTPAGLRDYITQEIPKWREVGRTMNLPELGR